MSKKKPPLEESELDQALEQDELIPFWRTAVSFVMEVFKVIIISLAIIIPVRYFLIQPFYVKGASMEPTLHDYQYLIIDEVSYRFADPLRGDIVVIKNPRNPKEFFIKRLIGLSGERVVIHRGEITIFQPGKTEGMELTEQYLKEEIETTGSVDVTLKANEFYVLGDNRDASLDSRTFGPISRKLIVGKTWIRAWPVGQFKIFSTPLY